MNHRILRSSGPSIAGEYQTEDASSQEPRVRHFASFALLYIGEVLNVANGYVVPRPPLLGPRRTEDSLPYATRVDGESMSAHVSFEEEEDVPLIREW
eukprot:CAMPEP_0175046028 /NCGR_PEP_ID=MMETSP0052_2-20121109/4793_1 /TAXON_ID=51329 ORGANISM="Polytomella parva, Strain SAG 63-3" /NCGR_SAMPLE_ID=MMETSP0052_2 /ASSEMBLY_ACC=CAM_ASM_000194 /LENGTH=96 /DNA_ID=CAMNT_0016309709 /DNA_START=851 /DNA_END=1138 /DNA_ORIENTATION=-